MGRLLGIFLLLLVLPGCVAFNRAGDADFRTTPPVTPAAGEALVNFYHPFGLEDVPVPANLGVLPGSFMPVFFKARNVYQIWLDGELAGFLPVASGKCFQLRVPPGRHHFLGRFVRSDAGNWNVMPADLAAGKTYFVAVSQRWNTWRPSVAFAVLKPADPDFGNIGACKQPFAYDRTAPASAAFWDDHVRDNRTEVRQVLQQLQQGSKDYYFDPALLPEDGR